MPSPFETVVQRLWDIGFFQYLLPFMISAAIFYGLLRKSQIFGEPGANVAVNAIIALGAAFMVIAYPVLVGVSIEKQFATFFFNAAISILTIVVGLMLASMFFGKDVASEIGEKLKTGRGWGIVLLFGVLVGGGVLFSSGLINVFFPVGVGGISGLSEETVLTIAALIVVGIILVAIVAPGAGKKP